MSVSERLNQAHGDNWRIDLMEPDLREVFILFRQLVSLEKESLDDFVRDLNDDGFVRLIKEIVRRWATATREQSEHSELRAFDLGVASGYSEALADCQRWASGRAELAD